MGHEEKEKGSGPEAACDVSNTWSAMSHSGHIGSVLSPSVALLTIKCILGNSQGGMFLTQHQIAVDIIYTVDSAQFLLDLFVCKQ